MNSPLRLLLCSTLALGCASIASAKITRTVTRSFDVTTPGLLHVSTQGGNVSVSVSTDNKATVTAHEKIDASDDAEADQMLKNLTLTIEQRGNDVIAESEFNHGDWGWHSHGISVSFEVSLPAKFAVEGKTSGGNITVTDRDAALNLKTSGGDIKLGKIGAEIDARTSGGNISLGSSTGDVSLHTSGGDIKAGPVTGTEDVSTSGGNINLVASGAGLDAGTSGGDVIVDFQGPITHDCSLRTSGGGIKCSIDSNSKLHLDASTSGGSVRAHGLTITIGDGGIGKSRLQGDVNGGGSLLKLRTSGGDIAIIPHNGAA